jgi:DNA repair exonuclease SbcCD ATPase subunit
MATLFDLTGDALRLQRQIDDAATDLFSDDPAVVAGATATLESLISAESDNRKAVEAKADAWCWVIDHIRAQAAARAAHAQRLKDLAATAEQQAEALQDRLVAALQKVDPDSTKWELPEHKLTSRKVASVELDPDLQPADLPEQFQRVKTTCTVDKAAIKAALALGAQIEGASLIERRSWTIK